MLIWVASFPRSGNRFFRRVCRLRYDLPERDKLLPAPADDPHYDLMHSLESIIASPRPAIVKTHDVRVADSHPAIYLIRDGRDALVSYAHFVIALVQKQTPEAAGHQSFHDTLRDLILQNCPNYGTWSDSVRFWTARPNTAVVRYEDLVRDPGGEADRAFAKIGVSVKRVSEELPTFEKMKQENTRIVRRGVVGSWKDEFPADLLPLFWKHSGDVMRACGYTDGALKAA